MNNKQEAVNSFSKLYETIVKLRSPEGCPWDREQNLISLRANLIEEAYECVDAINENDFSHIEEELGDVFLVSSMLGIIAEEEDSLSIAAALDKTVEKLIRRHPHVFGDAEASTAEAVITQWNDIKENQEGRRKKDSVLDKISKALPVQERAYRIQKAAAKAGFDWQDIEGPWDKLEEELQEARKACATLEADKNTNKEAFSELEEEIGDLLFSIINVSRKHEIDPSIALHRTTEKFSTRFRYVEKTMTQIGEKMQPDKLDLMNKYWEESKLKH